LSNHRIKKKKKKKIQNNRFIKIKTEINHEHSIQRQNKPVPMLILVILISEETQRENAQLLAVRRDEFDCLMRDEVAAAQRNIEESWNVRKEDRSHSVGDRRADDVQASQRGRPPNIIIS
jgi:hypothetical protein